MKKFALLAAAAALLAPALMSAPASAQDASVNIRIGDPSPTYRTYSPTYRTYSTSSGYRAYGAQRTKTVVTGPNCRQVTVRTVRSNGTVYTRKVRKCG